MTILRIERAVYGVHDVPTCSRFFEDFGLTRVQDEADGARFTTQVGQVVDLVSPDTPGLPPAAEPGSTLRELVWGVREQRDLDLLVTDLSRDRKVDVDDSGVAHTLDETGFGLGFAVANRSRPEQEGPGVRRWRSSLRGSGGRERWNSARPKVFRCLPSWWNGCGNRRRHSESHRRATSDVVTHQAESRGRRRKHLGRRPGIIRCHQRYSGDGSLRRRL